jgi:type II secretory pathway pseudopilin PulG
MSKPIVQAQKRGFTLIEIVLIIGIVAVLVVVVLLVLNPRELLARSRDAQRIADIDALKKAVSLYLTDVTTPNIGDPSLCYGTGVYQDEVSCVPDTLSIDRFDDPGYAILDNGRDVNGNGWLPVNLTQISSGSPLGQLPLDPINDDTYFYAYRPSATRTFEFNAAFESAKFRNGGSSDLESTDSGTDPNLYETGTALNL